MRATFAKNAHRGALPNVVGGREGLTIHPGRSERQRGASVRGRHVVMRENALDVRSHTIATSAGSFLRFAEWAESQPVA